MAIRPKTILKKSAEKMAAVTGIEPATLIEEMRGRRLTPGDMADWLELDPMTFWPIGLDPQLWSHIQLVWPQMALETGTVYPKRAYDAWQRHLALARVFSGQEPLFDERTGREIDYRGAAPGSDAWNAAYLVVVRSLLFLHAAGSRPLKSLLGPDLERYAAGVGLRLSTQEELDEWQRLYVGRAAAAKATGRPMELLL